MSHTHWVDTQPTLAQAVDWANQQSIIAFDTEFIRVSTFYAKPALVQLSNGEQTWLIDPVTLGVDWLKPLFESDTLFIGHALSEDLELFMAQVGCVPANFVDTQVGHAMATGDHLMGYANLVELRLSKELDKSASRSDWLTRPLSQKQMAYAVDDVLYLPELYQQIAEPLRQLGRYEWWLGESQRMTDAATATQQVDTWLERIATRTDLKGVHWPTLVALTQWRESTIRELDLPRNRLMKDEHLVQLARLKPSESWQFDRLQGVSGGVIKRYGDTWLQIVANHREQSSRLPKRLSQQLGKKAKGAIRTVAQSLNMPAEIVASGRDLQRYYQSIKTPGTSLPSLFTTGWRAELLTPKLNEVFKEESQ